MDTLGKSTFDFIKSVGESVIDMIPPQFRSYAQQLEQNPSLFSTFPKEVQDAICSAYSIYGKDIPACQNWKPSNWANIFSTLGSEFRRMYSPDTQYDTLSDVKRKSTLQKNLQKGTSDVFKGFEPKKHICLIGSTDSGKTTNTVTMLLKNRIFSYFDTFILCASGLDGQNFENFRKASMWNLMTRKKDVTNTFAYFKNDDVQKCIDFISDPDKRNKQKLVFFDDQQAISSKNIKTVGDFVMQAKNTNASLIVSLHQGYSQGPEKKIRDACQYMILFNQTEDTFNRLLGLKVGNALWKKYSLISNKYERVIIYDVNERSLWYGTGNYERFDTIKPDA